MANTSQTIFQRLGTIFSGRNSVSPVMTKLPPTFDSVASNQILYSTTDRNDYERKLNQYKQQKLLSYQWVKAGIDNSIESLAGLTAVKLMYRDADLMDGMPEIGAALDILSEEACSLKAMARCLMFIQNQRELKQFLKIYLQTGCISIQTYL